MTAAPGCYYPPGVILSCVSFFMASVTFFIKRCFRVLTANFPRMVECCPIGGESGSCCWSNSPRGSSA